MPVSNLPPPRCAIYCRLSREDEDKPGQSESIQNQKALLLEYALERDWEVIELYSDEDYSGADRQRPAFLQMLSAAQGGAFQIILCKTQSRFTRDMELVERYLHHLFPLWGIRFVTLADHVDTAQKGNKKARQINGLINEWYLEDLSENIRMVLDHKRAAGQHIGSFSLYGYQKHPSQKGTLTIDPPAASVVRDIFSQALAGKSPQEIADQLNAAQLPNPTLYNTQQGLSYRSANPCTSGKWNRGTISRMLKNEMYLGTMVQGTQRKISYKSAKLAPVSPEDWFRVEKTHAPIIDKETFETVQRLRKRRQKKGSTAPPHPLSGLAYCHHCQVPLQQNAYVYKENKHSYLRCPKKNCACSVRQEHLLDLVWRRTLEHIAHYFDDLSGESQKPPNSLSRSFAEALSALDLHLAKKQYACKELYLDKTSGLITPEQFSHIAGAITQDIENLLQQKSRLQADLAREQNATRFPLKKQWLPVLWQMPPSRPLLLQVIASISLEKKSASLGTQTVHLHWSF